ncbi:MAG: nitroreductase family protein [Lachnospiraceae bacterium]
MELSEAIAKRRSVRSYVENSKVSQEELEQIISAAILAPSWKNSQTGRYYVVVEPENVEYIKEKCLPEFNRNNSRYASALIVTAFEMNRAGFTREGLAENECGQGWGYYDLGLQNQNMLLKATELGLGTLIMGIRDGDKLREMLNIPSTQQIVSVIAVGRTDICPEMPKRKNVSDISKFF